MYFSTGTYTIHLTHNNSIGPYLWQRKTKSFPMLRLQQATKTDRSLFSILHHGSVDDKRMFNHFVFKAKLAFCLFVHSHAAQLRPPNTTRKQTMHLKQTNEETHTTTVNGKEETPEHHREDRISGLPPEL